MESFRTQPYMEGFQSQHFRTFSGPSLVFPGHFCNLTKIKSTDQELNVQVKWEKA
jgi:hypothetical protein